MSSRAHFAIFHQSRHLGLVCLPLGLVGIFYSGQMALPTDETERALTSHSLVETGVAVLTPIVNALAVPEAVHLAQEPALQVLAGGDPSTVLPNDETPTENVVAATIPDVVGLNLRKAQRQLRALGLRTIVRNEYGEPIDRESFADYKVRQQSLPAGDSISKGKWIRLHARSVSQVVGGY